METSSNPSLKPEVSSKKISNRRVKTKHTPILHENSDSSNHVGVNAKPRDHNEIDSPTINVDKISSSKTHDSNNVIVSSTPNVNNSVSNTVEDKENNDPNTNNVEDSQICAFSVNDRKLFMDCAKGDLNKYKHCVKIESKSKNLRDVWVGVTGRNSSIKFYICVKNSDDSLNTFFMDSNGKQQFESALESIVQTGDPNLLIQSKGLVCTSYPNLLIQSKGVVCTSLRYSNVDGNLVINDPLNHSKMVIFDDAMIYSYWDKKWVLERFIEYLLKKRDMMHYCEYIFTTLANYDEPNVTKNDFIDKFENSKPPNYIFTSTEMWNFYNK